MSTKRVVKGKRQKAALSNSYPEKNLTTLLKPHRQTMWIKIYMHFPDIDIIFFANLFRMRIFAESNLFAFG